MNDDNPQSVLCAGLLALLSVLFLGLAGCDQIERAAGNPALAAEVEVEAERLKLESDNQPVLPDDLGGTKEVSGTVDVTRRVLLFTDPPRCAPCQRVTPELTALAKNGWKVGRSEGMQIRVIERDEHPDWHEKYRADALPTWVLLVNGVEVDRKIGYLDRWQIAQFYHGNTPRMPQQNAPEVATQRPFAEPWRQEILRKHGRQAVSAHTDLDAETVALPETRINLRAQCIEFSGPSRESRLNRWFSVSFGAGSVSRSGSTVEFSNPPELRFHLFENGAGEKLDSLKAIEFTSDGAALHLSRLGTVRFGVK